MSLAPGIHESSRPKAGTAKKGAARSTPGLSAANAVYPEAFQAWVGRARHGLGVRWDAADGWLIYERYLEGFPRAEGVRLRPPPEAWVQFWLELSRLGVWSWAERYVSDRRRKDGIGWSLELVVGDQRLTTSGLNAFPPRRTPEPSRQFLGFCALVRDLIRSGVEFQPTSAA